MAVLFALLFTVIAGVLAFVGTKLYRIGQQLRRRSELLAETPPEDIVDLDAGIAKVEGEVRPAGEGTVSAPISGEEAVVAATSVERYKSKDSKWITHHEERAAVSFVVEDATGAVRVDPEGMDEELERETVVVEGEEEPPWRVRRYLEERADLEPSSGPIEAGPLTLDSGRRRYSEGALSPGETATVVGHASLDPDPDVDGVVRDPDGSDPGILADRPVEELDFGREAAIGTVMAAFSGLFVLLVVVMVAFVWFQTLTL